MKAIAVNGSPRMEKGDTAMVLAPFLQGLEEAGMEVELLYASRLRIKPCSCSNMNCWYTTPGECSIKDGLQPLYPRIKAADLLIFATPVYIPLPGAMQNFINRLCPLIEPYLEFRQGRTRARMHSDVKTRSFVLVSTGGWWEKQNMDTVVRIIEELARDASVEFGGALLRPHAFLMRQDGKITPDGEQVLEAAYQAGIQLGREGCMQPTTLEAISRPLISEPELRKEYNQWI